MHEYGITTNEFLEVVNELSTMMNKCDDKTANMISIKSNPNLSWWQKRRLLKLMKE